MTAVAHTAFRIAVSVFAVFSMVYTLMCGFEPIKSANATSNPLTQLISPVSTLTLVANTPTNLPRPAGWTGKACTVVLWNPTATPVYFGGPTLADGGITVGTVTVAGGMPICSNAAICITGPVSLDVSSVALVAAVGVSGIRYTFGGGC